MFKRTIGIAVTLLCLCLCLLPCYVHAESDLAADGLINLEKECTLTISYCHGETAFSDLQVKLYRIAEVSTQKYTLTEPFKASNILLNKAQTSDEWDAIRSTLEAYIIANGIEADEILATDQDGSVHFDSLDTGMYLAVVDDLIKEETHFRFGSSLISLPGLGQDGRWEYDISVNAKSEIIPPVQNVEYKVVKLWAGDKGRNDRPKSIEVDIFCDQDKFDTVVLSEENNWSYSWIAKDDGSNWMVAERNVPQGYTVTVEKKGASFVLTNTRIPTTPDTPQNPPETGDTANVLPYILIMTISGLTLMVMGIIGKRKVNEDK